MIFALFFFGLSCDTNEPIVKKGIYLYQGTDRFSGSYEYESNGIKKTVQYKNGLKNGSEKHFNSESKLVKTGQFSNGKPVGDFYSYYSNGEKKRHTQYKNGLHHGDYTEWYEDGQIALYSRFTDGKMVGHKKWRKNGKIYANYVVKNGRNIGLTGGKLCFSAKDTVKD
jgi:antitoxin component YwqK of YwqJK toxin-antitoxin module